MGLEKELETFERLKPELLLRESGKYAVILGDELLGTYDTLDDALQAGYAKYKLAQFMVKRVDPFERAMVITRLSAPCPA